MLSWYIATQTVMDLFYEAVRSPAMRVSNRWWQLEGVDLEGDLATAESEYE